MKQHKEEMRKLEYKTEKIEEEGDSNQITSGEEVDSDFKLAQLQMEQSMQ